MEHSYVEIVAEVIETFFAGFRNELIRDFEVFLLAADHRNQNEHQ
jgi:hypothetical protein